MMAAGFKAMPGLDVMLAKMSPMNRIGTIGDIG
jgi:hypothetical protein